LSKTWVKDLFDYNPEGYLIWKVSPRYGIAPGNIAGYQRKDGYWVINIRRYGGLHLLHRLIYEWHHGECPDLVDHKDKDHTNNRISNLRPNTKSGNMHNSDKSLGGVPYRGVSYNKKNGKYAAYFKHKGKRWFLGYFNSAVEASDAYIAKKKEVVGYVPNVDLL
jgi:hypothetical protein